MDRREKFLRTIRREMEGYIPFEFILCDSLQKKFNEVTGETDYRSYFDMPLRFMGVQPVDTGIEFSVYLDEKGNDIIYTEWGMAFKKGEYEHFSRWLHTMEKFTTIEEFERYPYPDPINGYCWEEFKKAADAVRSRDLITVASMQITIFETAWYMRGMDAFMMDMALNPELACYHLDRITAVQCEKAKRYALADVDVLSLGDDVSTQLDMMMSPEMWREFLKPRLKKVIDHAKDVKPEILIDYHGDGNLQKIIPDLIEIGVDILNPVQPECMDPVKIKEQYGDRLSFRGTIGTQTTMPFGTGNEVEEVCREMMEKVGKGGGLILAPTHVLEPEVPWENIEALVNSVKKYNITAKHLI